MKIKGKNRSEPRRLARYVAKLLFQFRVVVNRNSGVRRLCEERMIVFHAPTARSALAEAKRRGRAAQFRYKNSDGNPVHFEFVGVLDMLELGIECKRDEVWYNIVERVKPMERKSKILPREEKLNAIRNATGLIIHSTLPVSSRTAPGAGETAKTEIRKKLA